MKLHVIALDLDGTIAWDGRSDPEVADAVAEIREDGRVVVLVTGRILDDLRCQVGSLRAFDAVVAEEGAVIAFPESGSSRMLGARPPAALLDGLRARGLPFEAGPCLVECESGFAPRVGTRRTTTSCSRRAEWESPSPASSARSSNARASPTSTATCGGATSRAGWPTCSTTARWPHASRIWRSSIGSTMN